MPPKLRRTGIRKPAEPPMGRDLALGGNTDREIEAARRLVERSARGETDRDLLMAALGLNAAVAYVLLLTTAAGYHAWTRTHRTGGHHS